MSLARMIPRIFRRANARFGYPAIDVVRPIADWDLPSGFAYDQTLDLVRDSNGTVLRNVMDYWVTDHIYIVPVRHTLKDDVAMLQQLVVNGETTVGALDIWVMGATDIQRVLDAHRVKLGTRWYNVSNVQPFPAGYPAPPGLCARVTLLGHE